MKIPGIMSPIYYYSIYILVLKSGINCVNSLSQLEVVLVR